MRSLKAIQSICPETAKLAVPRFATAFGDVGRNRKRRPPKLEVKP